MYILGTEVKIDQHCKQTLFIHPKCNLLMQICKLKLAYLDNPSVPLLLLIYLAVMQIHVDDIKTGFNLYAVY